MAPKKIELKPAVDKLPLAVRKNGEMPYEYLVNQLTF
jgi:hypothetical protein